MSTRADAILDIVRDHIRKEGQYDVTNKRMFLDLMIFAYHNMRASENLLRVASECSDDDPKLKAYFEAHLEEEKDHEKWLADDLKSAGIDVSKTNIPFATLSMVGSVYYLIYHVDPAALLGYMLVMESLQMPDEKIADMERSFGKEAMRTAKYHKKNDPSHLVGIKEQINTLNDARQSFVGQVALNTTVTLCEVLKQLNKYKKAQELGVAV